MAKTGNKIEIIQTAELEICLFSEFTQSDLQADELARQQLNAQHRFDCYVWLWVTEGECPHLLDFQQVTQQTGEWLLIRPQQVHHFLSMQGWDGWGLSFPAEWLSAELGQTLPQKQQVTAEQAGLLELALKQLKQCRHFDWHGQTYQPLLQTQLHSFLALLTTLYAEKPSAQDHKKQRWQQFRQLLEQHFRSKHQVQFYAEQLACTEKTLGSACLAHTGLPAKTVINQRLLLEAKRLLVHTQQSIKQIALQLGFEEATHFNKFFKKYEGTTPKGFREGYLADKL
ncbi:MULTISPECIES: helix-turn-helix domain-containing protein [Glaesserella]|uniref:AraC family transcriptional regulator n=1 Tax=Glaesserella australis TaxID=2094024 RepID=A0A328BVZ9_9PAST|nr:MULTISPECIES: helix-turn-helix domain-containing protein [Glaesserella]AUI66011.1 AraC family transcriptional regulator [Glaesserella sp. 15-184]RAL18269.1 AraC family transcriptional regulator [Glaesserella australis]